MPVQLDQTRPGGSCSREIVAPCSRAGNTPRAIEPVVKWLAEMVGQGKFYDYEDITLVRAGDDLRIQRKGSVSLTGEVKSFFTGVDEIKITVNGERFRIAKPTGKVLVLRGIKKPSGECFSLVIKKEDARLVTHSKF